MCFFALLALFCGNLSRAADKSGVSPNTISVPKGPGSIEGLGESFQPTLNTGTAKYAIALKVPPGTAGHVPDLKLVYEAGSGNGPLGFGWTLALDYVQYRTDRGIPTYGRLPGFPRADAFITDAKEELVPATNGFYFCKNEGAFIRYGQVSNHWEGTLPTGTRLDFGLTDQGRIQDTNTSPTRSFAWLVEREADTHGNTILYSYSSFSGDANLNQRYLTDITYGPGAPPWNNFHFVHFIYEDRPDWFEDCRAGFPVRTGKRLKSIVIGTQGPVLAGHQQRDFNGDGIPDNLDRIYELNYLQYAGTNSHWSFLGSVQPVGADGTSRLPASTFGYTVNDPPDVQSAAGKQIASTNEPPYVMDNSLVDLVDANGDGLPDILKTEAGGGSHTVYLNQGQIIQGSQRLLSWSAAIEVQGDLLAQDFALADADAHLADMDGDGLADLVVRAAIDQVFYFPNHGKMTWGNRQPMAIQDFPPPAPFGETNVRTADIDFDKRIDIVQSDGTEYRIWCNLGNGQYSSRITVPQTNGFDFALPAVQIADFNGDRVPDVVWVRPDELIATAGLGYGQFGAPIHVPIPDFAPGSTRYLTADLMARAKLVDVTGDGLADLVIERVPGNELWCWINLGNYSLSNPKVITDMPEVIGANVAVRWADLNGNGTTDLIYADSLSIPRLQAVDVGELLNGGPTPNALLAISNGIGRVTLVGYQPSPTFALADATAGQPWPDPVPFPVNVVTSVTNLDSLGHQYATQFSYHNGYYDPGEHQFRGFGRVDQKDVGDPIAPTLVTRSYFDTGRDFQVMKGKLLGLTAMQEDGGTFWDETHSWTIPPIILMTGTNGTNVAYTHPTATAKIISELGQGTPRRLESEFGYDNYGNETMDAEYGIVENGDRSAGNDERITTTEYAINTNAWILRHPARQEIKDLNGAVLSRVESYYDDEAFLGEKFGRVTVGNLTLRREWFDASNPSAYIKSTRIKYDAYGNSVMLLDPLAAASGGMVDFTKGHAREISFESDFHTYPTAETIHIGNGSQPLVFQAAYDEGFGTITAALDFNTNQTTFGYDVFARLINIVKPYDNLSYPTVEYDYALAVPFPFPLGGGEGQGMVNYIETRQLDRAPGSAPTKRDHYMISRAFVDALGRKLMTKSEAEPSPGSSSPRVVITEATLFNARQKPSVTLNPCFSQLLTSSLDDLLVFESIEASGWQGQFEQNGTLVNLNLPSAHQSAMTYDATLRELRHTNPDGTIRTNSYEPLVQWSYDENDTDPASPFNNTPMGHYNDGLARLVRVDELARLNDDGTPSGIVNTWTTRYEYDLNDQLTRITDSQNNVKTMVYDGLKRKTFMDDPDRGHMIYVYDDASDLSETTDAKNQRITYTYDGANRILTEDYHDEGLPFSANRAFNPGSPISPNNRPDVAYFYDVPMSNLDQGDNTIATAHNTRGMLAYVWDLSGEEHTSYDARGRIEYTVKRIPDPVFYPTLQGSNAPPNPQLVSYRTGFDHDSLDRMTRLVYPDNDEVSYEYNERSFVKRIVGGPNGSVISNLVYKPSAQQSAIDYGNGVRTTYDYDNRLRLAHLSTFRTFSSTNDPQLINFSYDFDGVSNFKSITDLRRASAVPAGDPRRNTQLFKYDDLYRLTRAAYVLAVPPSPLPIGWGEGQSEDGHINYRYDRIGNMVSQTSDIQQYENGFSVTELGDMSYGGSGGKSGRTGRMTASPPGPHALTSVSQLSSNNPQPRVYPYDANGNMAIIDGLTNTWDFKDRLVGVENDHMRAEYSYDYTDRRIAKRVFAKTNVVSSTKPTLTTLYIDHYFEMRENDTPTKFVWQGDTRVARMTGSSTKATVVQRLRVSSGLNLVSLSVTAPNALLQLNAQPSIINQFDGEGQLEIVSSAWQWAQATETWQPLANTDNLTGGCVLWLKAATNALLPLVGHPETTTEANLPAGASYRAATAFGGTISEFNLPQDLTIARFDSTAKAWRTSFPTQIGNQAQPLSSLASGEALFFRATKPLGVMKRTMTLSIIYYHEDHITSSAVLSDSQGNSAEESAFYPFGSERIRLVKGTTADSYTFTQKEHDRESLLYYFGSRYLASTLNRFVTPDALYGGFNAMQSFQVQNELQIPQRLNLYAAVLNNPLRLYDPTGQREKSLGERIGGLVEALFTFPVELFTGGSSANAPEHETSQTLSRQTEAQQAAEVALTIGGGKLLGSGVSKLATFVGAKLEQRAAAAVLKAAEKIALKEGSARELVAEALEHVTAFKGTGAQKASLFEALLQKVQKKVGNFNFERSVGTKGEAIFSGTDPKSLRVITSEGKVYKGVFGPNTVGVNASGAQTVNYSTLTEVK